MKKHGKLSNSKRLPEPLPKPDKRSEAVRVQSGDRNLASYGKMIQEWKELITRCKVVTQLLQKTAAEGSFHPRA